MRLFVSSFDPGTTTGWAHWVGELGAPDQGLRGTLRAGELQHGELRSRSISFQDWVSESGAARILIQQMLVWMTEKEFVTVNGDELVIVIEDFILRPGPQGAARSGLSPVRMTAFMLAAIADSFMLMPTIVPQSPSQAKGFLTDERLKALGWWARGRPHSRDALRHVATYVARYRAAQRGRG